MNRRPIPTAVLILGLILGLGGPAGAVSTDVFRVRHPGEPRPIGHVPRSSRTVDIPPLKSARIPAPGRPNDGSRSFMARIPAPEPGLASTVDHDVRLTPAYRILQGDVSGSDVSGLFVRILRVNAPEDRNPVLAEGYLGKEGSFELGPVPSAWLRGETLRIRPVVYLKTPRLAGSLFSGGLPEKIYRLEGEAVTIKVPRQAFRLRLGTLRINPSQLQKRLVRRFARYVQKRKSGNRSAGPPRIEAFSGSESVLLPLVRSRTSSPNTGGDTEP